MRRYFNQRGSSRRPNIPNPPSKIQDVLKRGNFCEKWLRAVQEGNITMQEDLISALGTQLQITKAQAKSILKRFCEKRPTGTPDVSRWCKRFLAVMASGSNAGLGPILGEIAVAFGISQAAAYDLLKRRCSHSNGGDGVTGDPCKRITREICEKYLFHLRSGNQIGIDQTISNVATILNVSKAEASALLRRCCEKYNVIDTNGENGNGTVDSSTSEDCRITCYKCQNGNPVGMKFDPIKSSKANGRGYNYDCPRGWVNNPNPCKTSSNGNGNNNTVLPIRDVDNSVTFGTGTSSGSNNIGTAVPNRGIDAGTSGPYIVPFSGNLWMENE